MAYRLIQVVAIVNTIEEANEILAGYDAEDNIPIIEQIE